jgi:DNA repair exonuclease SbcCD ATPase subunit
MTTPEETRDRIKKMRDRIFKESDDNSLENNISDPPQDSDRELGQDPLDDNIEKTLQRTDLDLYTPKVAENFDSSSKSTKQTNLQAKLQQTDDRISLISADTQKQISEIALEFANKSGSLETEMLDKLEHTFTESNSKINAIEKLVNDNSTSLSLVNTALKNELSELNRSLQLDINSVTKRFSSANQNIETEIQNIGTELHNNADKLLKFEETVEEQQNTLEKVFYEKLQQNSDKLSEFKNSVKERQNSLEETFYERLQQNGDKLTNLSSETQRQISEIIREFASKSSSLEASMLDNLEQNFIESNSKIDGVKQLVNDNIKSSFQTNKALKERLDELNRSLQLDINSIKKRFSSADQKIEAELKDSRDKLLKFENSVEERQNTLEKVFYEKLQQNDDKLSSLNADTQKQISEIAQDFMSKNSTLESLILNKIEYISFNLKKVEEQIENQIKDFSTSLQKHVSSITTSQEEKIDAQAKKIQNSVRSLKQEIFDNQRDLQADFYKKIKDSEIKTHDYLSKKIVEVRELLSGEVKLLSEELANLNDVVKDKHSKLAIHVGNNVSSITKAAEKDRKYFDNRFEKVAESIQAVESKIVKEEELTELFQNYSLNVNISGDVKS